MEREQQYVGIDLHRRRSVLVRMDEAGEVLGVTKIENDPLALAMAVAEAGPNPEVALEACYGWYWAADLLQAESPGASGAPAGLALGYPPGQERREGFDRAGAPVAPE